MAAKAQRTKALLEVEKCEQAVAKWSAEAVARRTESEDLRRRAGDVVLSDESQAAAVAVRLRELQEAADVAERAAVSAEPRLLEARNAVLEIDAAAFDEEAAKHRESLAAHELKTRKLLSELEAHEGPFVSEESHLLGLISTGIKVLGEDGHPISITIPHSAVLRNRVAIAELRAAVLRDVIAGVDPEIRLRQHSSITDGKVFGLSRAEFYPPALWGPSAVLPVPASKRLQSSRA